MFQGAINFNQDLCTWSEDIPDNAIIVDMFKGTDDASDPSPTVGPFCHVCDSP
jgi:hypothetical protein